MNRTRAARVLAGALSAAAAMAMAAATLTTASALSGKVTYSRTISVPAPPKGAAGATGSGDGYDLSFDEGKVYNVFHHGSDLIVDCHVQATGDQCDHFGTAKFPVTVKGPGGTSFMTPNSSTTAINPATHHLFTYVTSMGPITAGGVTIPTRTAGVVEVNLGATTSADRFVRFIPTSGNGEGWTLTAGRLVGTRLYAINGRMTQAATTDSSNKLMCVDISRSTQCSGQPYAIGLNDAASIGMVTPIAYGGQLFFSDSTNLGCFDPATSQLCGSPWPISTAQAVIIPLPDAAGKPAGICLANRSKTCYGLNGAVITTPNGFELPNFIQEPLAFGARVYSTGITGLECYDVNAGAICKNFPARYPLFASPYTVQSDPANPTCLWINSDDGNRIQALDAFAGGACGASGSRVLLSTFVEAQTGCEPSKWGTLTVASASTPFAAGSVTLQDSSGADLASNVAMTLSGDKLTATLDLSTVSPALPLTTPYPSALLTLTDASGPIAFPVTVTMSWEGTFDDKCLASGQAATSGSETLVGSTTTVFPTTTEAPSTTSTTSTSTTLATTTTSAGATTTTVGGATTTSTTVAGATTTTVGGATTTSTTVGGATTTFTTTSTAVVSNTVVLTVPATATTAAPTTSTSSSTTTSLPPSTAVPVSVLGVSVRAAAPAAAAEVPAFTGSDDVDLAVLALVLIALAGIVLAAERATRRIDT